MKKSTLLLLKLFLLSFIFCIAFGNAKAWDDSRFELVYEDREDGTAKIKLLVQRYSLGNPSLLVHDNLYLEAKISGTWTAIARLQFNGDYGGSPNYLANFNAYDVKNMVDFDTDEAYYYLRYHITINESPSGVYNKPTEFRIREESEVKHTFNLTFWRLKSPSNFAASKDKCNKVELTWEAPDNLPSTYWVGNVFHYYKNYYIIERDNVEIFRSPGVFWYQVFENYIDTNVADGTSYDYKIKVEQRYSHIDVFVREGEFSSVKTGNSKAINVAPQNVTASKDKCNGTIMVNWEWAGTDPENFKVQRSTYTNFSTDTTTLRDDILNTRDYYEDTPPHKNVNYYYRVSALNDCGDWGDWSTHEEGLAPDVPDTPTNIGYSQANQVITISWDNSAFEDWYKLTRTNVNTGVTNVYDIQKNVTKYDDDAAEMCVPYTYELLAGNDCGNSGSVISNEVVMGVDLSATFWDGGLNASKGYYSDVVHLEWDNINRHQIEIFYIYRKEFGSTDSTLLTTLDANLTTFDDHYAVNGVLYEYSIKGEGFCNELSVFSNVVSDIGFKVPTATVSGRVTYQSGSPAAGVTLTAESTELPDFSSIELNGSTSSMQIEDMGVSLKDTFTFQAYIRFSRIKNAAIFNKGAQYGLNYLSATNSFVFNVGTTLLTFSYTPPIDTFIHVSAVFDGSKSYLYIDGELKATKSGISPPADNTNDFILGHESSANHFEGYIDEIRLWATALDSSTIGIYFNKYINGNEPDLIAYYRLNENINIDRFFDISKTGNYYNENHGTLTSCSYSTVVPKISQLWFRAITDQTGNYLITGIPYRTGGSVYKIVPMLAPHEFDPEFKTLFVGEGATVHNNIDFTDISTVPVILEVFYRNTHFPVTGVIVQVDGQYISDANNNLVQTKEDGTVEFDVPIGNHYLTFEKQNHLFNEPFFPGIDSLGNIERHLFNQQRSIGIYDTTRFKLAGKIVGGPVEAVKILGVDSLPQDPTINNIGVVNVELTTVRGFNIDFDENGNVVDNTPKTISFSTDPNTGEFEIWLLPEQYKPVDLGIKNNRYIFNSDKDKAIIDMTNQFFVKYETDSSFVDDADGNPVFEKLDSTAHYNLRRDWIYRSEPDFDVTNKDGEKIISHEKYGYTNENDVTDTITLASMSGDDIVYSFGKPIFFFGQEYNLKLKAFEEYINPARLGDSIDLVPVTDGRVLIANDLAYEQKDVELELDENGEAEHEFFADFPNIADPYTKNLNISFVSAGSIIQWPTMEAFILGGRPTGSNFVTTGPNNIDNILRDPPGSNSYAMFEENTVTSNKNTFSVTNKFNQALGINSLLGSTVVTTSGTPFFAMTNTVEAKNSLKLEINYSTTLGGGYEKTTVSRFYESFSTSNSPSFVGSEGDVFFGQSTNIVYGLTKIMDIMPTTEIPTGSDTIAQHNTYSISIEDGIRINPEFDTYFVYTQKTIEKEIIPNLYQLRNIMLEGSSYQKVFTDFTDPKYGSNNDDFDLWGVDTSGVLHDGPSYVYTLPSPLVDSIIDSVRYYNNQIANWIAILAQNEEEKTLAELDDNHKNISFGAGVTYKSSIGSDATHTGNFVFSFSLGLKFALSLGIAVNNTGMYLETSANNTLTVDEKYSGSVTTTDKVTYSLSDSNSKDYLTVDVKKCQAGHGPVFATKGGQTSCPYEGEEMTEYFEPGDHTLSVATMMIDGPQLSVNNPISPLVPETSPALFTMNLSNVSEAEKDLWYIIGVDVQKNRFGAKIMMDGSTINNGMSVYVPYGTTVVKTLEVYKGRPDVNDYENLGVYLRSSCESGISSEVLISAFFASACSPVELSYPGQGWVINFNDNDSMLVKIENFNLQHVGFEEILFQYTPTGTSDWTTVQTFTNYPLTEAEPGRTFIDGKTSLQFFWDMRSLPDRGYDIRLVSYCADGSVNYSQVLSGILDGQLPQVFGTPQPADGILNVDDDILVQFNEPIEGGLLTQYNFDIKGTLNNASIKHDAFLRFNGTTDFTAIPDGISFNDKSFTIEFWMRTDIYNNSVIFSQGNDPATSIEIGLSGIGSTYFKIGNVQFEAPFQFSAAVPSDEWQHMAYVYDYENGSIYIYQNDKIILEEQGVSPTFNNSGIIYLGKSSVTGGDFYAGSLHELRIWSKMWSLGDIYGNQYKALSGNEVSLYGYWTLSEAFGELAVDKAANRHMEIFAPWVVEPGGYAWDFSGDNFLEFSTGYFAIIPEMDYTIEFWFKDNNPADTVCLFSNQKGDGNEGDGLLEKALSIYATPDGKIWVASMGNILEAVSNDYFDNSWHHFSLVVRRRGNAITFIDGQAQSEKENIILGGIAGGKMYLGARKWDNINGFGTDRFYSGKMDEFRLWNLAKTTTQIRLDMNSKLHGEEIGLMAYFPFEGYFEDVFGNFNLETSYENYVPEINALDASPTFGDAFITDAPNVKDARPIEDIGFDWVAAEDKIIVAPKTFLMPQLEKNIIEITVEGIEDKYGNRMASPATWTAYVHRNQVRWEDERRSFTKEIYKPMDFVSTIKNTGGQQIGFSIINLPPWLTANPSSGDINPESTLEITFTINPALNIGEYNEDIILRTENGFDEKLPVTVRVYKTPPDWEVDPTKFEFTMNIVGRVKIEGVLSTDIFDKVAAFVNDSIRGVANVRYLKEFDSYLVFMNVHGNLSGEQLDFRLWDASVGQILDDVSPFDITFVPNGVEGTTLDPVLFEATGLYRQYIPVAKGWNWLSFNKLASNQNDLNSFFSALEPEQNDQIKTHGGGFNNFDIVTGWASGLIDSIDNQLMYQVKISNTDTVVYTGEQLIPEDYHIPLTADWNHIGYLPDLAMDVNDALRLYVADTSEIIKSQYAFSMYDPRVGWLGTLEVMYPGLGYMFKVNKIGTLTYPNGTVFKGAKIPIYTSPPLGWKNDLSEYDGNMSIVAQLNVSQSTEITINNQMVLGAFINSECHGFISPVSNSGIGYNPFFLNVSNSINGQFIEFRLFDGMSGNTYKIIEIKPFVKNAVYGTTQNPLELTLKELTTGGGGFESENFLYCYPNPFSGQVNVEFAGTNNAVTIDVVNATGSLVRRIFDGYPVSGTNKAVWDGNNQNGAVVSAGIYYIRFISGDSVKSVKISKTR